MNTVLLSAHVLAAIIFIGPVTVAVSLFPRYARQALTGVRSGLVSAPVGPAPGAGPAGVVTAADPEDSSVPLARLLHRISRVYSVLGLAVPVLGIALAVRLGVLGDVWLLVSIALTLVAAVLLAVVVLPAQHRAMALFDARSAIGSDERAAAVRAWVTGAKRLSMSSGVFALLWAVVVVLMIARPGSTTGV